MFLKTLLLYYRKLIYTKCSINVSHFSFFEKCFCLLRILIFLLVKTFSPPSWNSQCRGNGVGYGIIFKWVIHWSSSHTINGITVIEFSSRVEQCLVVLIIFNNSGWSKNIRLSLTRLGVCIRGIANTGKIKALVLSDEPVLHRVHDYLIRLLPEMETQQAKQFTPSWQRVGRNWRREINLCHSKALFNAMPDLE